MAKDVSHLHYRPPLHRTLHFEGRAYRVPADCRIIGTLDLGPDVTLAALRRHRESSDRPLWVDSLVLRTFCCGNEEVWYETRSSVSVPLGYAQALAKLVERAAAEPGPES